MTHDQSRIAIYKIDLTSHVNFKKIEIICMFDSFEINNRVICILRKTL